MWRKASKPWKWARGAQEQGGALARLEGSVLGGGRQGRAAQRSAEQFGWGAGSTAAGHRSRGTAAGVDWP